MVSGGHRPAWIPTPPLTSHKGGQGVRERVTPGGTGAGPPQGWSLGARGPGMQGLGPEVQTGMVGVDQVQLPMPGMPGMRDGSESREVTFPQFPLCGHQRSSSTGPRMSLPPAWSCHQPCPRVPAPGTKWPHSSLVNNTQTRPWCAGP